MADPELEETFRACVLDWGETSTQSWALRLHRDLIALRRSDAFISSAVRGGYDGAVLSSSSFLLRYFGAGKDRLIIINLGEAFDCDRSPEPLLAPPDGCAWKVAWSSDDEVYGGKGLCPVLEEGRWRIPAEAAVFLIAEQLASSP